MIQENKELLLRDLCARLPYGLCVQDEYGEIDYVNYNDVHFANYFDSILNGKVKPYLRPMSSMTEEEAKELSILCDITDVLSIKAEGFFNFPLLSFICGCYVCAEYKSFHQFPQ